MNLSRALKCCFALAATVLCAGCAPDLRDAKSADRLPTIFPDYTNILIPSRCAPLDFIIRDPGSRFRVDINVEDRPLLTVSSTKSLIRIPRRKWARVLEKNAGRQMSFNVFCRDGRGNWTKFSPFAVGISTDSIDRYLVYRKMPPLYIYYKTMGIYQRDLTGFQEKPLWLNRQSNDNCMNCHTFNQRDPEFFVAHMRKGPGSGTLIGIRGKLFKVNTATPINGPTGFPAWHPGGEMIAFSVNKVRQIFHATGENRAKALTTPRTLSST